MVLIPDGNRRWAKERGRPGYYGHKVGADSAEEIFKFAYDKKLNNLTFWGCSYNNITERDRIEVKFLLALFERMFLKLSKRKEIGKDGIRIRVLGRWEEIFPTRLKKVINNMVKSTENHSSLNLTFLMAYDGRDEMQAAIKNIAESGISPDKITREVIKQNLWTKDLPPVDLVIRTGGEPHWSAGLLMWDVAEAQLYFTKTFWPDFSPKEFEKALSLYAKTERRHGK